VVCRCSPCVLRAHSLCRTEGAAFGEHPDLRQGHNSTFARDSRLLSDPPKPALALRWNEEARVWCSRFFPYAELLQEAQCVFAKAGPEGSSRMRGNWHTMLEYLVQLRLCQPFH
jgi:hypothetical protein